MLTMVIHNFEDAVTGVVMEAENFSTHYTYYTVYTKIKFNLKT